MSECERNTRTCEELEAELMRLKDHLASGDRGTFEEMERLRAELDELRDKLERLRNDARNPNACPRCQNGNIERDAEGTSYCTAAGCGWEKRSHGRVNLDASDTLTHAIRAGQYTISRMENGSIWIQHDSGEGMEVSKEILQRYFKENFDE